jgi:hypothetical protein
LTASLGPVGAIILVITIAVVALIAVIWLLVKAFNAIKDATPEAQLQKAEETTKAAGEAADKAAEAYDNLKESLKGLDDQYAALENMTRGTREWNDAVNEINNAVLDLIDQYPELAALVKNKDGVMKLDIETDEVQEVLDKYQNQANTAKAVEIASKMAVVKRKEDVNFKALSHEAKYNQ